MNQLTIQTFSDLIQPGVYGIINNRNISSSAIPGDPIKIFIGYSKNMLKAITEQVCLIESNCHTYIKDPIDELQIVIIETNSNNLKISQTYWCDYYKAQGYQVLNDKRLLRYRTRIRVDNNFNILVELVNKESIPKIMGVFAKVSEAEAYCEFLNSNSPIVPIVSNSDLTLKYLKDNRIL